MQKWKIIEPRQNAIHRFQIPLHTSIHLKGASGGLRRRTQEKYHVLHDVRLAARIAGGILEKKNKIFGGK